MVILATVSPWAKGSLKCAHVGPGYRAYFARRAEVVYLLLLGGDKSSQKRDIKRAIEMAGTLEKK